MIQDKDEHSIAESIGDERIWVVEKHCDFILLVDQEQRRVRLMGIKRNAIECTQHRCRPAL
jgi:hypothetical protein